MAKIVVTLHGQTHIELTLQPGQEYYAGRGAQSDILLASERGISRQHIRIYEVDGVWTASLVSKYGGMVFEGDAVEQVQLQGEVHFTVPPYEFAFKETEDALAVVDHGSTPDAQKEDQASVSTSDQYARPDGDLDVTSVGISTLIPYLKIYNNKTKTEEVLKLEGQVWSAGRHPSCEIVVNDSSISRKHFDIVRKDEGFFVTDYGSSNGILVNGEKIPSRQPHKILSGDVLTVCHIEFIFEIHDGAYENKLMALPKLEPSEFADFDSPESTASGVVPSHMTLPALFENTDGGGPAVLKIPPAETGPKKILNSVTHKFNRLPQKMKMAIGAGAAALLLVFILSSPPEENKQGKDELGSEKALADLSPDKRKEVSDAFNLARNYYLQRKYVLCLAQIDRIHSVIPFYDNSKELQAHCKQGQELEQIEQDRIRKNEARAEVENRVRKTVEGCRQAISPITTIEQLNLCLYDAIQLSPEDPAIVELQTLVMVQENAEREKEEQEQAYRHRRQQGRELFNRATANHRAKRLKEALAQYQSFISGRYPGLKEQENEASRHVAAIENTLAEALREQTALCQSALERSELKTAIQACDKVLKENPGYQPAQEARNKAYSQLKREMKSLYEDSVLEESMGNIESAKEKWSKIIDRSIPQDDYYKKSSEKLKKYGIGM